MAQMFQFKDKPPISLDVKGKVLYDLYREERTKQGWEEWKWESLTDAQKLVWGRLSERVELLDD